MEFPACLTRPNVGNSFAGFPAAQNWNDLALWEAFLGRYPVASVLELGTWKGGMALFLALQCRARGAAFVTVDRDLGQVEPTELLAYLGAEVLALDLHGGDGEDGVRAILHRLPKPTLLFCDDGDKRMEWRRFVPLLSPGDFAAVHDWDSEFGDADLEPRLPYLVREACEAVASLTRFFAVV
jgi:cephalosporin hydroxylase